MDLSLEHAVSRGGGTAAFTPASVTPAIWFDPSDLTTIYTDAGVTNVTANDQAVYRMLNKGSLGGYVEHATLANRPLWKTGGLLRFDGSNDRLTSNITFDLSATGHLGFAAAFIPRSSTITNPIEFGNIATTSGSFALRQQAGTTANVGVLSYTSASDSLQTNAATFGINVAMVVTVPDFNITQAAAASKMPFRVNATVPAKSVGADGGGAGTVFGNLSLNLGFSPASGASCLYDFGGLIVKPSAFTTGAGGELAKIETWLGAKLGLTL